MFLLRNSAWSRRFLDVLAHEARSQPYSRVRPGIPFQGFPACQRPGVCTQELLSSVQACCE